MSSPPPSAPSSGGSASPPDIDPEIQTNADFGCAADVHRKPIGTGLHGRRLGAPIETFLNGWSRQSLRAAIRESMDLLVEEDPAGTSSKSANAQRVAQHLRSIAQQISLIAREVEERSRAGAENAP
jgi:hypothetical protein